eukprot:gnl/TRDRNA2_/TRDRNA2_175263_c0_seq10.p1 gnl/TRDRNA2_/TRDRNA2_175263_c0~~gnl/TRDRNA2_/TRDRNA2_175263_c0_seq10.p1  ORF type:complete len:107 (+),score=14.08 gnl/TRDRNA2_/TRDRNA2_175263_c0_seq10:118-438(+)
MGSPVFFLSICFVQNKDLGSQKWFRTCGQGALAEVKHESDSTRDEATRHCSVDDASGGLGPYLSMFIRRLYGFLLPKHSLQEFNLSLECNCDRQCGVRLSFLAALT